MDWLQLTLACEQAEVETLEAALLDSGALAVTYVDAEDQPLFEPKPGEMPLWGRIRLTGLYARGSDPRVIALRVSNTLGWSGLPENAFESLPEREWERAWLDDFQPMSFGNRLWIVPMAFEPPSPEAVNLRLDPGLAFGTGTHPTTALCLRWLDAAQLDGKDVIDFGCGSGVLGIAALLLGAASTVATDIDPQALTATGSNSESNGVAERLAAFLPQDMPTMTADVVLANILAGPLSELAPQLASLCRPGGWVVLSGLLVEQVDLLQNRYAEWFDMQPPVIDGDWARLTGRRLAVVP